MALMVDQQVHFKHFCKICKKGFVCGRALGGHMRAHGIGDESGSMEDDDPGSDWEDKIGGSAGGGGEGSDPPGNKRMYALRTNPNRLRSCRVCENCGKEFLSWKSFLEHGKCTSKDAESFVSFPTHSDGEDEPEAMGKRACGRWSKRKRSFRAKVGSFALNCPLSEEEDLANCLMMLSNATVEPFLMLDQQEESCTSASKEERRHPNPNPSPNPINFIAPLAARAPLDKVKWVGSNNSNGKGLFECKACKKVFNSHQALGGHRASHKKVKGCFAARLDRLEDNYGDEDVLANGQGFFRSVRSSTTLQMDHGGSSSSLVMSKKKSKVHECSICHRVFTSGQALGGHKRCHWITSNAPDTSTLARFQEIHDHLQQVQKRPLLIHSEQALDLNQPAPNEEIMGIRRDPRNLLSFEVPTDIFLQPCNDANVDSKDEQRDHRRKHHQDGGTEDKNNKDADKKTTNTSTYESMHNVEDEADSKAKLAKLSELKDMSVGDSSASWLQVGIGSSSNGIAADS